ncbi:hypothetical protein BKD26_26235 [Streptomyces sp. CB03238]|nr:hypothetical protein BKD26_26235 [Streptomyces sp. CB03238]
MHADLILDHLVLRETGTRTGCRPTACFIRVASRTTTRRFDIEHTFRMIKWITGWTSPGI